ncbi:MAG: EAL domain-containing protein [Desulfosporosinus sp.]|nr:EAL domain-containing protein [Desulfosporosinus sp.]
MEVTERIKNFLNLQGVKIINTKDLNSFNMDNLLYACAYHRIIYDMANKPLDYEFVEINTAYELVIGLKRQDVIGRRIAEIETGIIKDEFHWIGLYSEMVLSNQPVVKEYYSKKSNQWFLFQASSTEKGYFTSTLIDITSLKQREFELIRNNELLVHINEKNALLDKELRKKIEAISVNKGYMELIYKRYMGFVENSNDIIYSCGLDGIITSVNKRFCEIAKKDKQEIIGKELSQFMYFENSQIGWDKIILEVLRTGKTSCAEYSFKMIDGSARHYQVILSPILDVRKTIIEVLGINHDITTSKQDEQRMMVLAYRDSLTNLPNKNLFLDRLKTSIATFRRNGLKAAVVLVDLDDFKKINTALGYKVGNKIIIEVARKLVTCMRDYDTVARLSEDKFLLLFQNIRHINELFPIIDRINTVMGENCLVNGISIKVTASIGISVFPDDGVNAEDILINVEQAMYRAKELGKNRYNFFNNSMKEGFDRKVKLETNLKNAIINNEFVLHYQPQYEARTKRLRGFEALIRWNNPETGLIMPKEFIPFAEESALIVPIGKWVIDTACIVCNKINKSYGLNLNMSVNISAIQLKQPGFKEFVLNAIADSGIEASNLELEVTESCFIDNFNNVVGVLKDLQAEGIRITLADFGTGNLALGQLKKMPINMVKLDKEFIDEIDPTNPHDTLTESIISLVHKLNIEMLAGGVESKEQFDYLIKGKCDNIQGYFFEEPVEEEMIEGIISNGILENEALSRVIQKAGLTYEGFVRQKMQLVGKKMGY